MQKRAERAIKLDDFRRRYRQGNRAEKGKILDELNHIGSFLKLGILVRQYAL